MKKITLLTILLFLSAIQQINATTYYVDKNATGNGNGTSWTNAFITIEAALTTAIVGDQVWVASGVYKPTGVTYNIPNGIKLYGGFAGTETTLGQRDLSVNTTTLNGDIGVAGTANDNCKSVVTMTNPTNLNVFDGFRIINGYNNTSGKGGGIKVSGGSTTIQNCEFLANYAFEGACVGYSGAGILTILNCKMNNNNATDGAAIYVASGTVHVKGTKIQSNIATDNGGAIYSEFGNVIIDRCDVSGNSAADLGGAFYAGSTAKYEIYNSLIVGNLSEDNAVLYMAPITNEKTHKIINCTISGNRNTDTASTTSSSITLSYSGNCSFYNNIMRNNTAPIQLLNGVVRKCFINGTVVTDSANGVSTVNPVLVSIGDAAAAPFTTDGYDYHLASSSPAVNYGSNNYVDALYNLDLEGNSRIFDTTVDAGAYESQVLGIEDITPASIPFYYNISSGTVEFTENTEYLNKELTVYDYTGKKIYSTNVTSRSVTLQLTASGYYIAVVKGYSPVKFFKQ